MPKPLNLVETLHPYSLSTTELFCWKCSSSQTFVKDTETAQWICSACLAVYDDIPF